MEKIAGSAALGAAIKGRRNELGLRHSDVAAALGFSVRTSARIEEGFRGLANIGEEIAYARILQVDEEWFRQFTPEALAERAAAEAALQDDAPDGPVDAILGELRALRAEVAALREEHAALAAFIARDADPAVKAALRLGDVPPPPAQTGGRSAEGAGRVPLPRRADGRPPHGERLRSA